MTSLHLTNAYHPTSGGIRTWYHQVIDAAGRHGRPVRLVVPGERDAVETIGAHARIYTLKAPRAPVFDSRYRLILPWAYLRPWRNRILRILRDEQPDIVEIADRYSLCYLAGLLRREWMAGVARPALVGLTTERLDDNLAAFVSGGLAARRFAAWYLRTIYAQPFDHLLANSEYTAGELRAVLPPHRLPIVHVVPPGVDAIGFDPARRSRTVRGDWCVRAGGTDRSVLLLYAGRLSPEKHVGMLPHMMACLAADPLRDYRLILAGDGPLAAAVVREAGAAAPGRVLWLGAVRHVERLRDLVANVDAFVHPNPREPFGIAPLEAMAAGVPVVVPHTGGVRTYATPGNAWLADPTPQAFAAAVRTLAAEPAEAARRAARARATAEAFAADRAMARLFALYDAFAAERRPVGAPALPSPA